MPIHDWTRVTPGIFHHFHHEWISTLNRSLNAELPGDYYALAEQIAGGMGPDVLTLEARSGNEFQPTGEAGSGHGDGVGLALESAPPQVQFTATSAVERYSQRRSRIAIRHSSGDRVVAVLEIVSPGNKSSRHALRAFVEKAVQFLDSDVHLLIIDLFPPTPRDPQGIHSAIWSEIEETDFELPGDRRLTLVAYSSWETKRAFIQPVAVGEPLPDMPLFIEPGRYIPVHLDATYTSAFEAVPARWRAELDAENRAT